MFDFFKGFFVNNFYDSNTNKKNETVSLKHKVRKI